MEAFFGFNDLQESNDTLFICIVRNPVNWIESFYRNPWHVPRKIKNDTSSFLNNEFYSIHKKPFFDTPNHGPEIMEDRHICTKNRYKNIFELRYTKINFMLEDLPKKVKNYIFIRYEDLIENFDETMNKFKEKGLKVKNNIPFPINSKSYKNSNTTFNPENVKKFQIEKSTILNHPDFDIVIENKLKYLLNEES